MSAPKQRKPRTLEDERNRRALKTWRRRMAHYKATGETPPLMLETHPNALEDVWISVIGYPSELSP